MGREKEAGRLSLPDVFSFISCSVFSLVSFSVLQTHRSGYKLPGSTLVNLSTLQNVDNMDEETA